MFEANFFDGVIDVLPEPKVLGHVTGDQVVLGHEREEAAPAVRVATVARFHVQIGKAFA